MDKTPARRLTLAAAILTAGMFIAAICTPPVVNLLKIDPDVPIQDSTINPMKKLHWRWDELGQYSYYLRKGWLDRHFGLRKVLLRWEHYLDVRVLKSSMPSDMVLAGKGDWLYLAQENPYLNVVEDYHGTRLLTQEQLDVWITVFSARRDWLAARGIRYMVVVAPNKVSIYPEALPERFAYTSETTKLDQMGEALSAAGIHFVDLRPPLLAAKAQGKAYYRTDSHWTPYGAFFAYQEIVRNLARYFPSMKPASLEDFTVSETPGLRGGLSYMIALGDLYHENVLALEPKTPLKARELSGITAQLNHFQPLMAYENPDSSLPRVLVFRDSFTHELIPFLAEHFSRMYFVWPFPTDIIYARQFDTEAILREKPDIVIEQFVERYFTQPPPWTSISKLSELP